MRVIAEATCGWLHTNYKRRCWHTSAAGIAGFDGGSVDDFRGYFARLKNNLRYQETSTYGPHRADLLLSVDGRDARTLPHKDSKERWSLRLPAEVRELMQRLNASPVYDVSSNDQDRTRFLFSLIDESWSSLGEFDWGCSSRFEPAPKS